MSKQSTKKEKVIKKVEAGKTYFFCTCSLSKKYPLCDGTHRGRSPEKPILFKAERSESVSFCNGQISKILSAAE